MWTSGGAVAGGVIGGVAGSATTGGLGTGAGIRLGVAVGGSVGSFAGNAWNETVYDENEKQVQCIPLPTRARDPVTNMLVVSRDELTGEIIESQEKGTCARPTTYQRLKTVIGPLPLNSVCVLPQSHVQSKHYGVAGAAAADLPPVEDMCDGMVTSAMCNRTIADTIVGMEAGLGRCVASASGGSRAINSINSMVEQSVIGVEDALRELLSGISTAVSDPGAIVAAMLCEIGATMCSFLPISLLYVYSSGMTYATLWLLKKISEKLSFLDSCQVDDEGMDAGHEEVTEDDGSTGLVRTQGSRQLVAAAGSRRARVSSAIVGSLNVVGEMTHQITCTLLSSIISTVLTNTFAWMYQSITDNHSPENVPEKVLVKYMVNFIHDHNLGGPSCLNIFTSMARTVSDNSSIVCYPPDEQQVCGEETEGGALMSKCACPGGYIENPATFLCEPDLGDDDDVGIDITLTTAAGGDGLGSPTRVEAAKVLGIVSKYQQDNCTNGQQAAFVAPDLRTMTQLAAESQEISSLLECMDVVCDESTNTHSWNVFTRSCDPI